ncbi:uncharacterized protein LOC143358537 [Halictus rubicundus]|uniref:uncharacterized protein LOC143358537 n=1 Tax=Halictus rubicundus TaxID=77578 RepID=UPI0040372457
MRLYFIKLFSGLLFNSLNRHVHAKIRRVSNGIFTAAFRRIGHQHPAHLYIRLIQGHVRVSGLSVVLYADESPGIVRSLAFFGPFLVYTTQDAQRAVVGTSSLAATDLLNSSDNESLNNHKISDSQNYRNMNETRKMIDKHSLLDANKQRLELHSFLPLRNNCLKKNSRI